MRTFFALPIPAVANAPLHELCTQLQTQRGWRWIPPANWHITLAFLGQTDPLLLTTLTILGNAAAAAVKPSSLILNQLEWWPTAQAPRLLVATAPPVPAVTDLHRRLLEGLASAQIDVDAKALRPHLTLVRLQRDIPTAQPSLPPCNVEVPMQRLVLYSSEAGANGSVYRELWQANLGAN